MPPRVPGGNSPVALTGLFEQYVPLVVIWARLQGSSYHSTINKYEVLKYCGAQ
jgi:hypothetical protein